MTELRNTKKNFWIYLIIFLLFSATAIILKKVLLLKDFIDNSSIILVISPLLFIINMLLAYGLYDRIIRSAKKEQNAKTQIDKFTKANKIKFIFLAIGGIIIALTLILIWKSDYLYLLGIALILFLIAYPNKTKFDIEFDNFDKNKTQVKDTKIQGD